jgi:hypothetical protein
VAQTLSPLFQQNPTLQDLANKIGYAGPTDLASLIQLALNASTDPALGSAAAALSQLQTIVADINALPTLGGSWVSTGLSFAATVSGPSFQVSGLPANLDLLQALEGQFAQADNLLTSANGLGVQVASASTFIQALLSNNTTVPLLTYSLSSLTPLSAPITLPLATVMPLPGVSASAEVVITPSVQISGTIGLTVAGLSSGNFNLGLTGSALVTASVTAEAAVAILLGVPDADVYGYLIGGTETISVTATASPGAAFQLGSPTVTGGFDKHAVGPNLDLAGLEQLLQMSQQFNPMVLQYNVLQQGLASVGVNLPTYQNLQSQVSNAISNATQQVSNGLASFDPTNPNSIW